MPDGSVRYSLPRPDPHVPPVQPSPRNVHIETVPVLVWCDVDSGIADAIRWLNHVPGVRTFASCQGTIGEGGAEPYGPYVNAYVPRDAVDVVATRFKIKPDPHVTSDVILSPKPGALDAGAFLVPGDSGGGAGDVPASDQVSTRGSSAR